MCTRILIADDHQIVRDGLRTLLDGEPQLMVAGEASNGRDAVKLAKELKPDIVIMDISMPELNGIEAVRQIYKQHPSIKIIALSMHTDRRLIAEMLQAGASAFLLKECAFNELNLAISAVLRGGKYLSPKITGGLLDAVLHPTGKNTLEPLTATNLLTRRQREVLQLIAEGYSTKEISAQLHVSVKTVETHRLKMMQNLNMHSIAELTKYAVKEGLTSLEAIHKRKGKTT